MLAARSGCPWALLAREGRVDPTLSSYKSRLAGANAHSTTYLDDKMSWRWAKRSNRTILENDFRSLAFLDNIPEGPVCGESEGPA